MLGVYLVVDSLLFLFCDDDDADDFVLVLVGDDDVDDSPHQVRQLVRLELKSGHQAERSPNQERAPHDELLKSAAQRQCELSTT